MVVKNGAEHGEHKGPQGGIELAAASQGGAIQLVQAGNASAAVGEVVHIEAPAPGQHIEVVVHPGEKIVLDNIDLTTAELTQQDNGLLITLPNGGSILLVDFVGLAGSGEPPVLEAQGVDIPAVAVLSNLVEPAAGPGPTAGPGGPGGVAHEGGAGFSPFSIGELPPGLGIQALLNPTDFTTPTPNPELNPGGLNQLTAVTPGPIALSEAPSVSPVTGTVDESALPKIGSGGGTTTASGTLSFTDADGGKITAVSLEGGGSATESAGHLILTGSFFVLDVNQATGVYTYTLTGATGTDVPSPLVQTFDYTATDGVGNTATSTITISVVDDHPTAVSDADTLGAGHTVDANVISGVGETTPGVDIKGADQPVTVTGVVSGSHLGVDETTGVGSPITTSLGTLTLAADGSYSYVANPNESGTDTFTYTITDSDGSTSTALLTITVNGSAPEVSPATGSVLESGLPDGSAPNPANIVSSGTLSFSDPDVATITAVSLGATNATESAGHLILTGAFFTLDVNETTGAYTYTLTGATGTDVPSPLTQTFDYTVTDSFGNTSTSTLTITVTDDQPTAVPDADTIEAGHSTVIDPNVITGAGESIPGPDTQGADQPVHVTGVEVGAHLTDDVTTGVGTPITTSLGTLTLNADGSYSYHADPNVTGTDTFTYTIADSDGSTSSTTLTVTVEGSAPEVSPATGSVLESGLPDGSAPNAANIVSSGTLSFSDPDGATVTAVSLGATNATESAGHLILTGSFFTLDVNETTGAYTYTLTGATGTDVPSPLTQTFDYTVTDSFGNTSTSTLTITVTDDAPTAVSDADTLGAGHTVDANVISGSGETTPGVDIKGADQPATVTGVVSGSHLGVDETTGVGSPITTSLGTLTLAADGSYSYVANPNESGTDTFTYTITDTDGSTSTALLTIDVNSEAPSVSPVTGTVDESALSSGSGGGTTTASGTLSFTDADGGTITDLSIMSGGTATLTSGGGHLLLTGSFFTLDVNQTTGAYTYTLTGATTTDVPSPLVQTFDYTATDSLGNTATSTITISVVDDHPTAVSDADTLGAGHTVDANVISGVGETTPGVDIKGADQPVTVTGVVSGSHLGVDETTGVGSPITTSLGTLTLAADGSYSYVANPNESGTDTFTYTITDHDGSTSTALLTITVNGSAPEVSPATGSVLESGLPDGTSPNPANIVSSGTLSFSDPDGATITGLSGGGGTLTSTATDLMLTGTFFTLDVNKTTGAYTYTLTGATGTDSPGPLTQTFDYTVTDSFGNTSTSTITITVTDDHPIANPDTNGDTVGTLTPITGNVITNDIAGADGGIMVTSAHEGANSITIGTSFTTSLGAHLILNADGTYSYTDPTSTGTDTFTYTITDADGSTSSTTLTITVKGLEAQFLQGQLITNFNNSSKTDGHLLVTFTQEDDPTHSFQLVVDVPPGTGQFNNITAALPFTSLVNHNYIITVEDINNTSKIVIGGAADMPMIFDGADLSHTSIGGSSNYAIVGVIEPTSFGTTDTGTTIQNTTPSSMTDAGSTTVDYLLGTSGNDTITANSASGSSDLIDGFAGVDHITGSSGNDILVWDKTDGPIFDDFFNGGAGVDTLRVDGNGFTLDLTSLMNDDPNHLQNVEIIDLTGAAGSTFDSFGNFIATGANTLTLDPQSVLSENPTDNTEFPGQTTLFVLGDSNDTVNLNPTSGAHFAANGTVVSQGETFNVFTAVLSGQTVNVLIEQTVTHVNVV